MLGCPHLFACSIPRFPVTYGSSSDPGPARAVGGAPATPPPARRHVAHARLLNCAWPCSVVRLAAYRPRLTDDDLRTRPLNKFYASAAGAPSTRAFTLVSGPGLGRAIGSRSASTRGAVSPDHVSSAHRTTDQARTGPRP